MKSYEDDLNEILENWDTARYLNSRLNPTGCDLFYQPLHMHDFVIVLREHKEGEKIKYPGVYDGFGWVVDVDEEHYQATIRSLNWIKPVKNSLLIKINKEEVKRMIDNSIQV